MPIDLELFKYFFDQNWLVFASFGFALIMTFISFSNANITTLLPEESIRMINDGALIVDIREAAEFSKDHINDAISLPLTKIMTQTEEALKTLKSYQLKGHQIKGQHILIYCKNGVQSSSAIKKLKKSIPETEFISLQGGITEWKKSNYPTASSATERQTQKRKSKSNR